MMQPVIWPAGNFYGVVPYEGRYDALYPATVLHVDQNQSRFKLASILPGVSGEFGMPNG